MRQSKADRCLLYSNKPTGTSVFVIQVDDTMGTATDEFLAREEEQSQRIVCKPRTIIEVGSKMTFNGTEISHPCPNVFRLSKREKLTMLTKCESRADLISWGASIQYVSGSCRPDLTAACQLAATPVAAPSPKRATISLLNFLVQVCHDTCDDGLTFVPLDISSIRIVAHSDAAFANAEDLKSQLGFVILMVDDQDTANIVHFGSRRCTRVTRSVMAAELHGLILGFDVLCTSRRWRQAFSVVTFLLMLWWILNLSLMSFLV